MRQIAVTFPYFFEGEDTAIRRLIDSGWFRVHIRKPDAKKDDVAGLLCKLPQNYRHAISLHDHFQLAEEFGLGGIHLNGRNPEIPADWRGLVSLVATVWRRSGNGNHWITFFSVLYSTVFQRKDIKALSVSKNWQESRLKMYSHWEV